MGEIEAELANQKKRQKEEQEKRLREIKRLQQEELAKKNNKKTVQKMISERDLRNALQQKHELEKMLAERKNRGKNVSRNQQGLGNNQNSIKNELTTLMMQMNQPGFPAEHTQAILTTLQQLLVNKNTGNQT